MLFRSVRGNAGNSLTLLWLHKGTQGIELINHYLYFLWQDNAVVLSISTAFAIYKGQRDYVVKTRKRPLNNIIAGAIFGTLSTKELLIPKVINYYNYNHNLVNISDHLRANFTYERRWETRN